MASIQTFNLQPVNEDEIPKFLEEAELPAAQQAYQSGMCSSEDEALKLVKSQTKDILEKLKDKTFLEEWKSHNFIFYISLSESQIPSGYLWYSIEGKEAFIENIFLEKECRGKGIAANVLNGLEAELRTKGLECIRLHVFTDNQAAYKLYRKLGYEVKVTNIINSVNMIKMLNN